MVGGLSFTFSLLAAPVSSFPISASSVFILSSVFDLSVFNFYCNNNKQTSSADDSGKKDTVAAGKIKTIIFFGNSLTAGYGIDPALAFPALIQKKIDSQL